MDSISIHDESLSSAIADDWQAIMRGQANLFTQMYVMCQKSPTEAAALLNISIREAESLADVPAENLTGLNDLTQLLFTFPSTVKSGGATRPGSMLKFVIDQLSMDNPNFVEVAAFERARIDSTKRVSGS